MNIKWSKNIYDCSFPALIQEKLNGVFATLKDCLFYSKNGNIFDGFIGVWYEDVVIGELYVPGKCLQEIVSMVRNAAPEVRFYAHWFPELSYEENVKIFTTPSTKYLTVRSDIVHSLEEARAHEFARTGEGAVLKDKFGRWFKLKRFFTEEFECTGAVVNKSLSLTLRAHNGELFRCGSFEFPSEHVRKLCDNKPIGKNITVRFHEYTKRGVPRNPVVVAIRDYE